MLASEVMDSSAALLNDASKEIFTYPAQLPYLKIAFKRTLLTLAAHNIATFKEESSILAVPALAIVINTSSTPALPADLFLPIKLEERKTGTTDSFSDMILREWEPEDEMREFLEVWAYRESEIKLRGSTVATDVKVSYFKQPTITSENTVISEVTLELVLAYRVAALCARYIGENYQRYNDLMREYKEIESEYLSIHGGMNQAFPSRRPGYRENYRRGTWR